MCKPVSWVNSEPKRHKHWEKIGVGGVKSELQIFSGKYPYQRGDVLCVHMTNSG